MKLTSVVAIAMLMSVSCKMEQSKTDDKPDQGNQPIVVSTERNFTDSEVVIGKRICAALKNKRELFETITNMQEQFRFRGEAKECGEVNPSTILEFPASISNTSTTDFEYVSTRVNFFRDVITDQSGVMKPFCDAFAKNGAVSNQITSGNNLLRLNLLISEGYDRIEIAKLNKDKSLVSTEAVSIITSTSQAGKKFFGVEKDRIRYSLCASATNAKQFSSVRQIWLSAITPF